MGCHALLQGIFPTQGLNPHLLMSPALAGGFFTTRVTWKGPRFQYWWAKGLELFLPPDLQHRFPLWVSQCTLLCVPHISGSPGIMLSVNGSCYGELRLLGTQIHVQILKLKIRPINHSERCETKVEGRKIIKQGKKSSFMSSFSHKVWSLGEIHRVLDSGSPFNSFSSFAFSFKSIIILACVFRFPKPITHSVLPWCILSSSWALDKSRGTFPSWWNIC